MQRWIIIRHARYLYHAWGSLGGLTLWEPHGYLVQASDYEHLQAVWEGKI